MCSTSDCEDDFRIWVCKRGMCANDPTSIRWQMLDERDLVGLEDLNGPCFSGEGFLGHFGFLLSGWLSAGLNVFRGCGMP